LIDIELIRATQNIIRKSAEQRGQVYPVNKMLELDLQRRENIVKSDNLRSHRNAVSKSLGQTKIKPPALLQEMRDVGTKIKQLEEEIKTISEQLTEMLMNIPNIPDVSVPPGLNESGNIIAKTMGNIPEFDFKPRPHWEIATDLGILDLEGGVRLAQSRFYVLRGKGAILQRSLINWMLNKHGRENDYEELYLPFMVNRDTVTGSSHLPHFEENMYHDSEDDLFLVPTAEAPMTGLFRDQIIEESNLPMKFVSHTPCWRREKFSAGRDTRGIKRVHQFDKVELYKFVKPENSYHELNLLLLDIEGLVVDLDIPYRVLELCAGDLGFSAAKTYDVEMWSPGSTEWLEVSSCSNCTDFQSRRSAIRYRPKQGGKLELVHTLNGSGLAVPRVLIAILENYQQKDGSVIIPEVLRPYTGFDIINK
jgi:seryl-tRNA synthetase